MVGRRSKSKEKCQGDCTTDEKGLVEEMNKLGEGRGRKEQEDRSGNGEKAVET